MSGAALRGAHVSWRQYSRPAGGPLHQECRRQLTLQRAQSASHETQYWYFQCDVDKSQYRVQYLYISAGGRPMEGTRHRWTRS